MENRGLIFEDQGSHRPGRTSVSKKMERLPLLLIVMSLLGLAALAGCNRDTQRPDVKDDVNNAMTRNDLGVVKVAQDRDKGAITLTGDVDSADKKAQAESVAKQAAPGYAISNELGVRPVGNESQAKSVDSNLDSAIQDNYKASLKAHKNLDDQSISYDAKNGTLVLKGSVKTPAQKKEAIQLAKAVPNVKEVVNEIEVKSDKSSTAQ
jgi:hyperosmotically inducible periplasmic protein